MSGVQADGEYDGEHEGGADRGHEGDGGHPDWGQPRRAGRRATDLAPVLCSDHCDI